MKLRRRFAGESRGRCLLTNPVTDRGATLWAAGNERRASLVNSYHPAPSFWSFGEGSIRHGILAEAVSGPGGVLAAARKERVGSKLVKPSWPRGESPRSKVGPGNRDRRPEGGRWARQSEEPLVMRGDPATSGAGPGTASPGSGKGARLIDIP